MVSFVKTMLWIFIFSIITIYSSFVFFPCKIDKQIPCEQPFVSTSVGNKTVLFYTLVSRRPPIKVLGTPVLRADKFLYVDNQFYQKKCGNYNKYCHKEDLDLFMDHVCEKEMTGFMLKEDDFVLCVSEEELLEILEYYNLFNDVVMLGYGLGLLYVPKEKCRLLRHLWRNCPSTPDDCLKVLKKQYKKAAVHFNIPMAVHYTSKNKYKLHHHNCDPLCFVECHDQGNTQPNRIQINKWLDSKNITAKIPKKKLWCNGHEEQKFDPKYCYSYEKDYAEVSDKDKSTA